MSRVRRGSVTTVYYDDFPGIFRNVNNVRSFDECSPFHPPGLPFPGFPGPCRITRVYGPAHRSRAILRDETDMETSELLYAMAFPPINFPPWKNGREPSPPVAIFISSLFPRRPCKIEDFPSADERFMRVILLK